MLLCSPCMRSPPAKLNARSLEAVHIVLLGALLAVVTFAACTRALAAPSALEQAIRNNNIQQVRAALNSGTPSPDKSEQGTPLLTLAINLSDDNIVDEIVRHAKAITVESASRDHVPQHAAAEWGRNRVLRALLAIGAGVNSLDSRKQTPLHHAVAGAQEESVNFLLESNADPNIVGQNGTPLTAAVLWNYHDSREGIIKLLLRRGADPNLGSVGGSTALDLAIRRDDRLMLEVVDLLLSAGADPSRNDRRGRSALDRARESRSPALAAIFQKHSFPVAVESTASPDKPKQTRFNPATAPIPTVVAEPNKPLTNTMFLAYGAQKGGLKVRVQLRGERAAHLGFGSSGDLHVVTSGNYIVQVPEGARELGFVIVNHSPPEKQSAVDAYTTILDADGNATHVSRLNLKIVVRPMSASRP